MSKFQTTSVALKQKKETYQGKEVTKWVGSLELPTGERIIINTTAEVFNSDKLDRNGNRYPAAIFLNCTKLPRNYKPTKTRNGSFA